MEEHVQKEKRGEESGEKVRKEHSKKGNAGGGRKAVKEVKRKMEWKICF